MASTAGHGISLKADHYDALLTKPPRIEWAEGVTENFLGRGGRPSAVLERLRRETHLILHGVSMSLGGTDPFDDGYFRALRRLADHIEASLISDHLCFGSFGGHMGHDLWPMPRTEESLKHLTARVIEAQDRLGRQLVIENVSSYVEFADNELSEPEFIAELLAAADARMLLDVNNVHVSAQNFGFDAQAYIERIPPARVAYIHVAGHEDKGTHLLDNHGGPVCDAVWNLYVHALRHLGPTPTIVEWDSNLPSLERMLAESERARELERQLLQVAS